MSEFYSVDPNFGPCVDVTVMHSEVTRDKNLALSAKALIDTGAAYTVLHPDVCAQLKLEEFDKVCISTAGGLTQIAVRYLAQLQFQGRPAFHLVCVASLPPSKGTTMLLGRDTLDLCKLTFVYDGGRRAFSLTSNTPG